jgi:SNF2 family DNA or RNA helicase
MEEILQSCDSAEEALIKRAATFDLKGEHGTAEDACKAVVAVREKQLRATKDDIVRQICKAEGMKAAVWAYSKAFAVEQLKVVKSGLQLFEEWKRNGQLLGDNDAQAEMKRLMEKAKSKGPMELNWKFIKGDDGNDPLDHQWELREQCHHLRRLQNEFVGRVRSLRYIKAVQELQSHPSPDGFAMLSCCGHQGLYTVLKEDAGHRKCKVKGCEVPVRPEHVVRARDLGNHGSGGNVVMAGKFGTKLTKIMRMLKSLPATERVLVFVQFQDLRNKVREAINEIGIRTGSIEGTARQKMKVLTEFQQENSRLRILLLDLAGDSASGANLVVANHLVFVHPLVAESQWKFSQQELQAIGRVVRYGQQKKVYIHRFIVEDSIDSQILRRWKSEKVSELDPIVVPANVNDFNQIPL